MLGSVEALFAEESLEVKPAEASTEVLGSFEVPFEVPAPCTNRPAWWPRGDKPSYASSMSDTSGLSDDDLEDIVMNLQKQSRDDNQVSKSDESDYDESDDADQVLGVDDHIFPVDEPYWCAEHEFSDVHDDELHGFPPSPGPLLPTGVKWNCRLYANQYRCRLWSCLCSLALPPYLGILHSGSAGLMPAFCRFRRR